MALGLNKSDNGPTPVSLGGFHHQVHRSPDNAHFSEVDLIGTDFMNSYEINLWWEHRKKIGKMYIGGGWKAPSKQEV